MTWLVLGVSVLLVVMALATVLVRDLKSAIILLSTMSLFASLLFLMVAAPDVAITEAAIGSALTTVIFVIALFRTRKAGPADDASPDQAVDESAAGVRREGVTHA